MLNVLFKVFFFDSVLVGFGILLFIIIGQYSTFISFSSRLGEGKGYGTQEQYCYVFPMTVKKLFTYFLSMLSFAVHIYLSLLKSFSIKH